MTAAVTHVLDALTAGRFATDIGHSLREGFYMLWDTLWALVLGFTLSGAVQAFVSRESMQARLGDHRPASVVRASAYGMVSSSCSYAASAMARSLFVKGADFLASMVFMFASTNLVIELGIVLLVLIGWQFLVAEFVGGVIMIGLLVAAGGLWWRGRVLAEARAAAESAGDHGHDQHSRAQHDHAQHTQAEHGDHAAGQPAAGEAHCHEEQASVQQTSVPAEAATGCHCHTAEEAPPAGDHCHQEAETHDDHGTAPDDWRRQIRTAAGWSDAAGYTMSDLTMLRKELLIGFTVAGFLTELVPAHIWQDLLVSGHGFWTSLENVVVGPFIALISFVCSIGNVPLAAALWKGGSSFGGVVAFIFADLITLPLLLIYRKQYGTRMALRMLAVFWVVMSAAGLATEYIFRGAGWIPAHTATITEDSLRWNYTTVLDIIALVAFAGLYWLYRQRERLGAGVGYAKDPICGMQVEIAHAPARVEHDGETVYFCSDHCAQRFSAGREGGIAEVGGRNAR